jgi:hypothetical protein
MGVLSYQIFFTSGWVPLEAQEHGVLWFTRTAPLSFLKRIFMAVVARHASTMRVLLLVALSLLALGQAQADDAEEGAEAGSDYASQFEGEDSGPKKVTAHPDVKASFVFPDFAKTRFPMGENVDVLIAFSNTGSKTFNLTAVAGTLHPPFNFNFVVQNVSVAPGPRAHRAAAHVLTPAPSSSRDPLSLPCAPQPAADACS